ncbi:mitochondrial ubiquitin ligase activator of nfkb 1-A isoform 1-T2 [Pholidichthys leucotaenia]
MSDLPVNPLVLIGVGSSFVFSGLFYHLYKDKKKEIKQLKEIPVFRPDEHLLQVLKSSPYKRLQYVAVEGQVQADGERLASQFVPQCFGVIQKINVEEHRKYWNSVTSTWDSRKVNSKETNNLVPFSLINPGFYSSDIRLKVRNPLEASGYFLERVYHRVRHAEEGLVIAALEVLQGERLVAKEENEEMLRVGSTMMGFGEVVLEDHRVMRLQAPVNGRKYILVPTDYRSYMDGQESSASMWFTLSALTGIVGASVLGGIVYNLARKKDGRSN